VKQFIKGQFRPSYSMCLRSFTGFPDEWNW
jgi:hypothetical protein